MQGLRNMNISYKGIIIKISFSNRVARISQENVDIH